uniref:Uncharacterized protein n=1 Tax=Arundo donax TaxID=35708 RepID=A0A0A9JQM8_ARUDO
MMNMMVRLYHPAAYYNVCLCSLKNLLYHLKESHYNFVALNSKQDAYQNYIDKKEQCPYFLKAGAQQASNEIGPGQNSDPWPPQLKRMALHLVADFLPYSEPHLCHIMLLKISKQIAPQYQCP